MRRLPRLERLSFCDRPCFWSVFMVVILICYLKKYSDSHSTFYIKVRDKKANKYKYQMKITCMEIACRFVQFYCNV